MSAELFARIRHLSEQVKHLADEFDRLNERVMALEADRTEAVELDVETLEPLKRGPGRPRKAAQ